MTGEAALVALAAAIYLFDCVVLLERGQALIQPGKLHFGSRHYQIAGKAVALANPFTPFVPLLRSLALFSSPAEKSVKVSKAFRAIAPLAALAAVQFLLVFAVLPWCLYRAPGWPFFVALVLAYLNAIGMLLWLFLRFRASQIPARPLIGLGFGWIVCLPLSVNCLRAAGVSIPLGVDAMQAMRFLPDRQKARTDLAAQVTEAMQELDETDSNHVRLATLARDLQPEAGNGRL